MSTTFKIVNLKKEYYEYLKKFDNRIQNNHDNKKNRPYVGVLINIGTLKYFAPLSSPKPKHLTMNNTIDFYKINDGKFGVINFNNMIPLMDDNYIEVDLNERLTNENEQRYQMLLIDQLRWLNLNDDKVKNKAKTLYNLYTRGRLPENVCKRCCDFKLLEEKCSLYNKKKVSVC